MFDALSNSKPSRASVVLLLRFVVAQICDFQKCENVVITEARSEGLIELKLVRKPPKVSRGSGGGARGRAVPGSSDFLGALSYNQQFGGLLVVSFSSLPELDT